MKRTSWPAAVLVLVSLLPAAEGAGRKSGLAGTIVEHTHRIGRDRRIWSDALDRNRNLYVYLPPGYDPGRQYPLMIWMHGVALSPRESIDLFIAPLDRAICAGRLPPMIVALPDGTRHGKVPRVGEYSFFINSKLGCFEDYIEQDVWNFVVEHYPIRPEREAHILAGFSGGGMAAYYHAIQYRERYGVVIGLAPPLNLRWLDCHGRYFAPFDPDCWGWRESVRPGHEVIGRFYCVVTFRLGQFAYPLFGRRADAIDAIARHNPVEMIDDHCLRPGELSMFVAYGGRDEFNTAAQVESFMYRARERGLTVGVAYDPQGKHRWSSMEKMLPCVFDWLGPQLVPYAPPVWLGPIEVEEK